VVLADIGFGSFGAKVVRWNRWYGAEPI
jgi:hypothetical protein